MSETETNEPTEPTVTDVPEPDQEPHEPIPDEADEAEEEAETPATDETDDLKEAAAPKSEKEIDKALKSVERAGTTYRNAIGRAMGEDAQALEVCPRCNAPVAGMIFPPEMAPVDDETRDAVLVSLGLAGDGARELRDAAGVHECDKCDGWGQLKFPTKVPHVQEQTCPACQGSGYVLDAQAPAPTIYLAPEQATTSTATIPQVGPCPRCGMAGMDGQPHFCNPASATG